MAALAALLAETHILTVVFAECHRDTGSAHWTQTNTGQS